MQSGHIDPGQLAVHRFTLTAATKLVFNSLTNSSVLSWRLTGPRGVEVNSFNFDGSDSVFFASPSALDLPPGDYVLTVNGVGDTDADYAFRLLNLASASPVTLGTSTSGTINPANETDAYRFTGAAGDQISITKETGNGAGSVFLRILDPSGRLLAAPSYFGGTTSFTLPMAGSYTVLLESYVTETVNHAYSFTVARTGNTPPADLSQGTPLVLGQTNSGTLDGTSPALFTFTTTGAKRVYFDAQSHSGQTWELIGPRGVERGPISFFGSDSWENGGNVGIDLPLAGTYQLRLAGPAGAFAFRLLDLAVGTTLPLDNTRIEGALAPSRETDIYHFTGVAGERLVLDVQTFADSSLRLFDPFGRPVLGPTSFDDREIVLEFAGTYTMLVEGRAYTNIASDDYAFVLNRAVDAAPVALNSRHPHRKHCGRTRQYTSLPLYVVGRTAGGVRFLHRQFQP